MSGTEHMIFDARNSSFNPGYFQLISGSWYWERSSSASDPGKLLHDRVDNNEPDWLWSVIQGKAASGREQA